MSRVTQRDRVSFLPKSKEKSLMRLSINNLTPTIENTMTKIIHHNGTETSPITCDSGFDSVQKWNCAIALQIPIHFSCRYFLPSLDQVVRGIKLISESFGGSRVWLEIGTYIGSQGKLLFDVNIWIKSQMTQEKFDQNLTKVQKFACATRDRLAQEAVVVEFNNQMELY
jgi:hypothetical protein